METRISTDLGSRTDEHGSTEPGDARPRAQPRPIVVFAGVEISQRSQRADREPRRGSVEILPSGVAIAAAGPRAPAEVGVGSFPDSSDGPTPEHNRVPAAGLGRKRVTLMETQYRQWDSETSAGAMDAPGRGPSVRARVGRTLRHWTTNHLESVGKTTTTASGTGDWGLADGRRRNLVAVEIEVAGRPNRSVVKSALEAGTAGIAAGPTRSRRRWTGPSRASTARKCASSSLSGHGNRLRDHADKIVSWMTGEPGGDVHRPAARGRNSLRLPGASRAEVQTDRSHG